MGKNGWFILGVERGKQYGNLFCQGLIKFVEYAHDLWGITY
jgi:hypothetical protein